MVEAFRLFSAGNLFASAEERVLHDVCLSIYLFVCLLGTSRKNY